MGSMSVNSLVIDCWLIGSTGIYVLSNVVVCSKWKKEEKTPAGSSVSSQKLLWPLVFLPNEGCKHGWKMLQKYIILLLRCLLLQRTENWWSFRERHDLDAQPHRIWRTRNQTTLSRQVFSSFFRRSKWKGISIWESPFMMSDIRVGWGVQDSPQNRTL